jgi:pantoate kinase
MTSHPHSLIASGRAFAPAHITGFFVIYPNGSTGAGVNLQVGAETEIALYQGSGETTIEINGKDRNAPVSRKVLEVFQPHLEGRHITSSTTTSFPVGFGFGMSGAGSFSFSLALNDALQAGKSYTECMQIAAAAEIECGTGLGTVMTQQYSGFLIGDAPYPSRSARRIACEEDTVVCCFLEAIETGTIIRDAGWKEKINAIGNECMEEINREPTVSKFTQLARYFTFETGLASEPVRRIMHEVDKASMAMLGQTLYAVVHRSEAADIERAFRKHTDRTQVVALGDRAAMVLP